MIKITNLSQSFRTHSAKIASLLFGFSIGIVIICYGVRVMTDLLRVRIPPRSEIQGYQFYPLAPGFIELRILVNSEISPNCIRMRADLGMPESGIPIIQGKGDIPKGVAAIGSFANGMGTGNPGLLPISYTIPNNVCGRQVLHTRFVYICPIANGWWPAQEAIQMTPRIHITFPDCPATPVEPLGPAVWFADMPTLPP